MAVSGVYSIQRSLMLHRFLVLLELIRAIILLVREVPTIERSVPYRVALGTQNWRNWCVPAVEPGRNVCQPGQEDVDQHICGLVPALTMITEPTLRHGEVD